MTSQVDPPAAPSVEQRLDMLMQVLCGLHEAEVITDPAVSASKTDEGTAVTVEFLLDSPRVAVVRPPDVELRQELARTVANTANRNVEQLSDGESYAVADGIISAGFCDAATDLLAEPVSAVVRPTRHQLAHAISEFWGQRVSHTPRDLADALLAEFWPGAVSDSQETPE